MKRLAAALLCALCASAAALAVPKGAKTAELTLPDGYRVKADLALDRESQARGLMFRESLPAGYGMLFVFPEDGVKQFWMKNTFVDLDMVFLDADLKVLKVFHRVPRSSGAGQPEPELARASAPARCVLELPAGAARAHKVRPGAALRISFPRK